MREKLLGAVTLIVLIGIVGATILTREPDVTLLYPGNSPSGSMWPLDHAWRWSVHRLPIGWNGWGGTNDLTLVARVKHTPHLGDKGAPQRPRRIEASEAAEEILVGSFQNAHAGDNVAVAVQLIDLDRVGVAHEGGRFRLLMTLECHGAARYLTGDATRIQASELVGWQPNQPAIWEHGELHLGYFHLKTETDHVTYDIVMTARNSAAPAK